MGRSTGYTYAKNGTVQQTVTTGYGSDGRINSAGFLHGGSEKQFSYEYMAGTHLLEKLTMPNNMDLTQSYEIQRNLLTGTAYHRGTTLVANRQYSYDTLGRPTARNTSRQGTVKNESNGPSGWQIWRDGSRCTNGGYSFTPVGIAAGLLIGGFLGSAAGELVVNLICSDEKEDISQK